MTKYYQNETIEAFQMTADCYYDTASWPEFVREAWNKTRDEIGALYYITEDDQTVMVLNVDREDENGVSEHDVINTNDWIVNGKTSLYYCEPDYFAKLYSEVIEEVEPENDPDDKLTSLGAAINELSSIVHQRNVDAGWWTDPHSGEDLRGFKEGLPPVFSNAKRDLLNLLCLVHSEVSEAAEGVRKNLPDDKLPYRSMLEVEIADVFIRCFDIIGAHNLDLGGAIVEKLEFNKNRPDHKIENRLKADGKKY